MKQYPAKKLFKKYHKPNYSYSKLQEKRRFTLNNGFTGIKANNFGKLTYRQLEACRRTLRRGLKKKGKIWINCFTDIPITRKSIASRMGKGKGSISHWIATVRKGQIIFEIPQFISKTNLVLQKALSRLPFKSKIESLKY